MGEIQCFWTEPTAEEAVSLRRYSSGSKCSGEMGIHDASADIGRAPKNDGPMRSGKGAFSDDTRWPVNCSCGYVFVETDDWQVFRTTVYRAADGREWPLRELPPGAMYDAAWYHEMPHMTGPDGVALIVMLPGGGYNYWHVDGQANNNPAPQGWTRTGTVPNVTANPSILTPRYHGWLRNGVLVEC